MPNIENEYVWEVSKDNIITVLRGIKEYHSKGLLEFNIIHQVYHDSVRGRHLINADEDEYLFTYKLSVPGRNDDFEINAPMSKDMFDYFALNGISLVKLRFYLIEEIYSPWEIDFIPNEKGDIAIIRLEKECPEGAYRPDNLPDFLKNITIPKEKGEFDSNFKLAVKGWNDNYQTAIKDHTLVDNMRSFLKSLSLQR